MDHYKLTQSAESLRAQMEEKSSMADMLKRVEGEMISQQMVLISPNDYKTKILEERF